VLPAAPYQAQRGISNQVQIQIHLSREGIILRLILAFEDEIGDGH
jgi:hypothetical protein